MKYRTINNIKQEKISKYTKQQTSNISTTKQIKNNKYQTANDKNLTKMPD